jgi:hypothetical protein
MQFFQKKQQKSLPVPKKALPLHRVKRNAPAKGYEMRK